MSKDIIIDENSLSENIAKRIKALGHTHIHDCPECQTFLKNLITPQQPTETQHSSLDELLNCPNCQPIFKPAIDKLKIEAYDLGRISILEKIANLKKSSKTPPTKQEDKLL